MPLKLAAMEDTPPVLRGFERINRYWDPQHECFAAKILPGEYYVTIRDEWVVTVLGSCVSACIRDRVFGIGGMNHFMLPSGGAAGGGESARYGVYAMELLINEILKNGGRRQNMEVKITGGGQVLAQMTDIGARNISFVRQFLETENLAVTGEDVGDVWPRKVYYHPASGKVRVKKLREQHNDTIVQREHSYMRDIEQKPAQGDVELF